MTAIWLDNARYADSNGYQFDNARTMWPWRDWVIDAFRQNMPFDRFVTEQLAGDLLENPTQRAADRHRLQPQPRLLDRGRHHRRGIPRDVRQRQDDHRRHPVSRADLRLRALPRPQVRPDLDAGTTTRSTPSSTPAPNAGHRARTGASRRRPHPSSNRRSDAPGGTGAGHDHEGEAARDLHPEPGASSTSRAKRSSPHARRSCRPSTATPPTASAWRSG